MPSQLHDLIANGGFCKPASFSHVEGSFPLDEALEHALPKSFTLLSATPFAKSDFSITGRLDGRMLPDSSPKSYFVKCASGDEGRMVLEGEHASLRAIEAASPGLVPGVVGFGEFKSRPSGHNIYFLVEDFLELRKPSIPNSDEFAARIVGMHLSGKSPEGETIIYDAGSYYAHNEMELGIWRVIYAETLGASAYREAYLRLCPPAEPANEWDDRNRLYSLKCNLNWSATDPGIITRTIAYNDMCYLCEKYAPLDGIAKYDPSKDPTVNPIAQ